MGMHHGEGVSVRAIGPDNHCLPSGPMRLFDTVDCSAAQAVLDRLLSNVASGCGRVQINGSSPSSSCVLISTAELDSLEQALEILSSTDGAASMRAELSEIVAKAGAHHAVLSAPLLNVLIKQPAVPGA